MLEFVGRILPLEWKKWQKNLQIKHLNSLVKKKPKIKNIYNITTNWKTPADLVISVISALLIRFHHLQRPFASICLRNGRRSWAGEPFNKKIIIIMNFFAWFVRQSNELLKHGINKTNAFNKKCSLHHHQRKKSAFIY